MSFISRKLHFRADDYVCAGQKKPLLPQQQKQQEARFVFLCFCVLRAGVCRGEKSGMIVKFVQISFPYHHRLSPLRLRPSPPLLLPCRCQNVSVCVLLGEGSRGEKRQGEKR